MSARFLACCVVACLAATPAWAADYRETVLRVPVAAGAGARPDQIEVTLFMPPGRGPFPLAVLSHGSPRTPSDRRRGGRVRFEQQSRALMEMGYAVAVPTRRGYGDSGGEWSEGYGSCDRPDYYAAGMETARDIAATVEAVRRYPGIEARRIFLLGQSAGGWGSLAASTLPIEGLAAVVNFAGGRGSYQPNAVCGESFLVEAAARFGGASKVPQLWFYSANDHYFAPALARRLHTAFVGAGGRAQLVEVPANGSDGHGYFARSVADWSPAVKTFLQGAPAGAAPHAASTATKGP